MTLNDFKINSNSSATTLLDKIDEAIEQSISLCMDSAELLFRFSIIRNSTPSKIRSNDATLPTCSHLQ
ncbi:hypothetical protein QQG55_56140 [Brugia pahangi]